MAELQRNQLLDTMRVVPEGEWAMKARRSSAASTAACLALRLSAISSALRLAPVVGAATLER
jgi:hypothetical protein